MAQQKHDQPSHRRGNIWIDQHEREWGGTMSKDTGTPIGEIQPMGGTRHGERFGWTPVLYAGRELRPGMEYLRFSEDRPNRVMIDYDRWRQDLLIANSRWSSEATNWATRFYGGGGIADALANPPQELLDVMGPKPMPVDLVDAMEQGNRWILGLTPEKPDWVAQYPGLGETLARKTKQFADAKQFPDAELVTAGKGKKGKFTDDGEVPKG